MSNHEQLPKQEQDVDNSLTPMLRDEWVSRQMTPAVIILIYSIIQLVLHTEGDPAAHYLFMIIGSIVTFVDIRLHASSFFRYKKPELLFAPSRTIANSLVYIFACYVIFYQGFLGFSELSDGFSIWVTAKSVIAIFLGYNLIKIVSGISDAKREVRESNDTDTENHQT